MWNDEDNNPYGSFDRRDSDLSQPESPISRMFAWSGSLAGGSAD